MMKSGLTFFGFLLLSLMVYSQGNYPPPNLIQSFNREYPKSEHAVWDHGKAGWYVRFKDRQGVVTTAFYDKNGKRCETQVLCDSSILPTAIRQNINRKYSDIKKIEYARIDHPGRKSIYMAQFKQNDQFKTVYLSADGKEISFHDAMIAVPPIIDLKPS